MIKTLYLNNSLNVRLFALWISGILMNLSSWTIGYQFLPEKLFKGIFPGGTFVPDHGTILEVLTPIIIYNILLAGLLISVANIFRAGWFPLGYFPVLFHWSLFGLFLGTNSFDISKSSKIAPSLYHLFLSPGFLEISAYTFIAAATINLYQYQQKSLFSFSARKVKKWNQIKLYKCDIITIAVSIILILTGGFYETLNILN